MRRRCSSVAVMSSGQRVSYIPPGLRKSGLAMFVFHHVFIGCKIECKHRRKFTNNTANPICIMSYIPDATLTPAPVSMITDLHSGDRTYRARPTKSAIAFILSDYLYATLLILLQSLPEVESSGLPVFVSVRIVPVIRGGKRWRRLAGEDGDRNTS